jgi:hypothetical protein
MASPPNEPQSQLGLRIAVAVFGLIGVYCFLAPEALRNDAAWDDLPNKRFFSYANGLIFFGGAILFLAHHDPTVKQWPRTRASARRLGTALLLAGIVCVAWSIYHAS